MISILNQKGNTCEICIRKNGTARITVSSVANDAISDWVEFTVDLTTRVTSVSLDQNMLSLWEGQDAQLRATVTPANADDQRLIWSSDKPEVAEVTQTGYVTAKKDGTAGTRTFLNGKGASALPSSVSSHYSVFKSADGRHWLTDDPEGMHRTAPPSGRQVREPSLITNIFTAIRKKPRKGRS